MRLPTIYHETLLELGPSPSVAAWADSIPVTHTGRRLRVLDIAAGPGVHSLPFVRRPDEFDVTILDADEHALAMGVDYYRALQLTVKTKAADIHRLPIGPSRIHIVLAIYAFSEEIDNQQVLAEAARVLIRGGTLFIETPAHRFIRDFSEQLLSAIDPHTFALDDRAETFGNNGAPVIVARYKKR